MGCIQLLASPALCADLWSRLRALTGATQTHQNLLILGLCQAGCSLLPPIACLFEGSSRVFAGAAHSRALEFALTYFCSWSLIFFYNEYPVCMCGVFVCMRELWVSFTHSSLFILRFRCIALCCVVRCIAGVLHAFLSQICGCDER